MPRGLALAGFASELVLVASPNPPRLRRLIVHRRLVDPSPCPEDTLGAA